jgi:poly-gamma-glutamate synthesis protein (capsule biosynthesis protein)
MILIFAIISQLPSEARVSFCAVGDVLLDRGVRKKITAHGIDYPFEFVSSFVNGFDLAFCNLECPVSYRGVSTGKVYCFRADTGFFAGVKNAGFNVFSLANNHTIDWGKTACMDTKDIIEKNCLHAVGVGKNQTEARTPVIIHKNGLVFAFFAYVGTPLEGIIWAKSKPGPAQASIEEIVCDVKSVRPFVDYVIVSIHWGIEYTHTPMKRQILGAHEIIDAGADLIIGHHPHVLQSIELYKDRFILYSLGNFVFDQHKQYQRESAIFSCIFQKGSIDSLAVHPVYLENFRPQLVKDSAYARIAEKIKRYSRGYNTTFFRFDSTMFLTDSLLSLSYPVPLKTAKIRRNRVEVFNTKIEIVDTSHNAMKSIVFDSTDEIKDCCFIKDTQLHLFAVIGRRDKKLGECLVHYTIEDTLVTEIWRDQNTEYCPWKLTIADVNGDTVPELCVGVSSTPDQFATGRNHIILYTWEDGRMRAKWCESRYQQPFIDFTFTDIDKDGLDDLITLEIDNDGTTRIMTYQWLGIGFWGYKPLAKGLRENWLCNVAVDSLLNR